MERLNHHHLYLFWTLAREGTFTKTAESLHIAQSAVTSQIKSLEEVLGLRLIDRANKRKPTLTDEGKKVLAYADTIFETAQDLMNWSRGSEPSKVQLLRVGALSGLSRNLQYEFLKAAVGIPSVRVEVTTGDQERLVRLLSEHSLDIILSSHNVKSEGRASFHSHVLTSSRVVFVSQASSHKTKQTLKAQLSKRPLYIPGKNFEARPELEAYLESLGVSLTIAGEIDDIALLRIFALRSGAIVAIPEMGVLTEIKERSLTLIEVTKVEQRFYAITRQRRYPNALVERLISSLRHFKAP